MQFHFVKDRIVNRSEATLTVFDLAVLRGYGVFDFFKVLAGVPIFIDDHVKRFIHSCEKLRLKMDLPADSIKSLVYAIIEKNEMKDGSIKLILSGGVSSNGFDVDGSPTLLILAGDLNFKVYHSFHQIKQLKLKTLEYVREIPDVKSTNYLVAMKHWDQIINGGFDDFLFVKDNMVSESSRANFFIVNEKNQLVTPDIDILHGITRKYACSIAQTIMDVQVRALEWEEVINAKEAFLTSTTKQAMPVIQIDNFRIGSGKPGNYTEKIFEGFHKMETEYIRNAKRLVLTD